MISSFSIFFKSSISLASWMKSIRNDFIIVLLKSMKFENNFILHIFSIMFNNLNQFIHCFDCSALSSLHTSTSKLRIKSCNKMTTNSLWVLSAFVICRSIQHFRVLFIVFLNSYSSLNDEWRRQIHIIHSWINLENEQNEYEFIRFCDVINRFHCHSKCYFFIN